MSARVFDMTVEYRTDIVYDESGGTLNKTEVKFLLLSESACGKSGCEP